MKTSSQTNLTCSWSTRSVHDVYYQSIDSGHVQWGTANYKKDEDINCAKWWGNTQHTAQCLAQTVKPVLTWYFDTYCNLKTICWLSTLEFSADFLFGLVFPVASKKWNSECHVTFSGRSGRLSLPTTLQQRAYSHVTRALPRKRLAHPCWTFPNITLMLPTSPLVDVSMFVVASVMWCHRKTKSDSPLPSWSHLGPRRSRIGLGWAETDFSATSDVCVPFLILRRSAMFLVDVCILLAFGTAVFLFVSVPNSLVGPNRLHR